MTTFTTDDRMSAAGVFTEEHQLNILSRMVNYQYEQVKGMLDRTKEKPLSAAQIMEISQQNLDRYQFARAIEKAHHIGE